MPVTAPADVNYTMCDPTAREPHDRHRERMARLDERVCTAWKEYLAMTRASAENAYDQTEPFAWRRLRRSLVELAGERRRADFELDRALADWHGTRRAA
jgi:hypothetical protein